MHRKHLSRIAISTALASIGINTWAATVTCGTTLYFCSYGPNDTITLTTTDATSISPLRGYGVYLSNNQATVNDITIKTSTSQADAIRTNSPATYFNANRVIIQTTGSSADGINLASNTSQNFDGLVLIKNYANITTTSGVAVRANNFQNENSNSVIILPAESFLSSSSPTASNSSDTIGYAVFSGNKGIDTNGLVFFTNTSRSKQQHTRKLLCIHR